MNCSSTEHTFAICAYKTSRYLEECIISLKSQTIQSTLLLATSTPNEHIKGLCEKYDIPLFVNTGESGIAGDWNFAVGCADTPLITIAHQDDTYEPEYTEKMLNAVNKADKHIIFFTDYYELRNGEKVAKNKLLNIKRLLLFPLRFFKRSIFVRRRVLSLGCSICCPSVTFNAEILKNNPFKSGFKSDLDWQQWENLSKLKGSFLYYPEPLMCHRIHEESATTGIIGENSRTVEDYEMFSKFWPKPIAKMLSNIYASGEKSNNLKK